MAQQTAVEFIKQELDKLGLLDKGQVMTNIFEQAKQMEKQQIIDAFDEGQEYEYQYHINGAPKFDSETYFAETYGSDETLKDYHIVDTNEMVEISDEEIEKAAQIYAAKGSEIDMPYGNGLFYGFNAGIKWYREQLKKKQ